MSQHHHPIEPEDRGQFTLELNRLARTSFDAGLVVGSSTVPMNEKAQKAVERASQVLRSFLSRWAGPAAAQDKQDEQSPFPADSFESLKLIR